MRYVVRVQVLHTLRNVQRDLVLLHRTERDGLIVDERAQIRLN